MHDRLEPRRLFATVLQVTFTTQALAISGGLGNNDDILVTYNPSDRLLRVYNNGALRATGLADTLKSININLTDFTSTIYYDTNRITIDSSVPARIPCTIDTGYGDDTLIGGNGNDRLSTQGGTDQMFGNGGDDGIGLMSGIGHGGDGNDTLTGATACDLFGDAGIDTVDFLSNAGVYVNLSDDLANDGPAGSNNNAHSDIENIVGGDGNDYLVGNSSANDIRSFGGNDTVYGLDGNDVIVGGDGDDSLVGNANRDWIQGGTGNDVIRGYGGKDSLFGEDGIDKLYGGDGNDYLYGGSSNDRLQGDAGNDALFGQKGDDHFYAKNDGGIDRLYGDVGNDDARVDAGDILNRIEIVA